MAKERKREDKRAGNECEKGSSRRKKTIQDSGVSWQRGTGRREIMKTRRGCGTRLRQRESQERGIRPFSLFLDVVDADRTMSSELPFRCTVRKTLPLFSSLLSENGTGAIPTSSIFRAAETRQNVSRAKCIERIFIVSDKHRDHFRVQSPTSRPELDEIVSVSITARLYS